MQAIDFLSDPQQVAPPRSLRIDLDDGSFVLRSPVALKPYARCVGEWLERWARETPEAPAPGMPRTEKPTEQSARP
ncbi:hypothetical protein, partial [Comamonas thiooxydans]|uniref:hypothetical protein n=1 Tax=Comamonas thiooxydans TaxID=363952 RepID=UPI00325FD7B6